MRRKVEKLSRAQRRRTPPAFARYLYHRVIAWTGVDMLAVLWLEPTSYYYASRLHMVLYGPYRDARTYAGPWPIIAHPPCGPWGQWRWKSLESKEHGRIALDLVHRYGGVVEQPLGSSLFTEHGRPGHILERVNQGDYGHLARKATLLYFVL